MAFFEQLREGLAKRAVEAAYARAAKYLDLSSGIHSRLTQGLDDEDANVREYARGLSDILRRMQVLENSPEDVYFGRAKSSARLLESDYRFDTPPHKTYSAIIGREIPYPQGHKDTLFVHLAQIAARVFQPPEEEGQTMFTRFKKSEQEHSGWKASVDVNSDWRLWVIGGQPDHANVFLEPIEKPEYTKR